MKEIIKNIIMLAENGGTRVFAVGGYLRDFLLKKQSSDLDIAVSSHAGEFAKKLAKKIKGKFIVLDEENKNYRIAAFNGGVLKYIDVSLMAGKTIADDLKKRDFTVNAMAVPIERFFDIRNNLIDPFGGSRDLKKKTVEAVSNNVFKDDPLRMLRGLRIASDFKFNVSKKTLALMKKNASGIKKTAPERVKNELFRILSDKAGSKYIVIADETGLLEKIFPVISKMKKSAQNFYYHPKGLFQHTMLTLEALEDILNNTEIYFKDDAERVEKHLNAVFSENVDKKNLLKFIALFHDCAKPECAKRTGGKLRFLEHEEKGAEKIEKIMNGLKMGKKETEYAKNIVKNHMRPSNLLKTGHATERAKLRFFRDIGENTPDLLITALADWHSYRGLKIYSKKILKLQEKHVSRFVSDYFALLREQPKRKIIDGNVIMRKLSLKPGKIVGALLELIREGRDKGLITNQKDALAFAKLKLTALRKIYKI